MWHVKWLFWILLFGGEKQQPETRLLQQSKPEAENQKFLYLSPNKNANDSVFFQLSTNVMEPQDLLEPIHFIPEPWSLKVH